jgi:hypothetical protein
MTDVLTATCASCGVGIQGTKFCENCGAPVAIAAPTAYPARPRNPFEPGAGQPNSPALANGAGSPRGKLSPRGRLIAVISIVVVVVLVVGGGGALWYFASKLGGAASPEAAAVKLVSSFQTMDPVGIYGSLAPSEVSEVTQAFQKLSGVHPKSNGVNLQSELTSLKKSLTITTTGVAYRTDQLADGVARVVWTKGSIKINGSAKQLANVEVDLEAPAIRSAGENNHESTTEINRTITDMRKSLSGEIRLPQTLQASKAGGLSLIVVNEGSGWYVSPVLSLADEYFRGYAENKQNYDGKADQTFINPAVAHKADSDFLGSTVVDAGNYGSPDAAAKALVKATFDNDSRAVAATLSLPERRLVSVYGPWLEQALSSTDGSAKTAYGTVTVKAAQFSSTIVGAKADVRIDDLDLSDTQYNNDVHQNLTKDIEIQGTCASVNGQDVEDSGYYDDEGQWVAQQNIESTRWHGCFSSVSALSRLGFTKLTLVAVSENGKWVISPFTTMSNAVSIVTDNFLTYYKAGRLKQLFAN